MHVGPLREKNGTLIANPTQVYLGLRAGALTVQVTLRSLGVNSLQRRHGRTRCSWLFSVRSPA